MAGCLVILAAGLPGSAFAETVTYRATLSGENEVPPHDSGSSGEAVVTFDTETRQVTWTVTFTELSTPMIGAHMHGPAGMGENAGVLVPLQPGPSPMEGSAVLTEAQAGFLEGGLIYVNLHSERYPGGELRGNLTK